jgi:hypothetical protein
MHVITLFGAQFIPDAPDFFNGVFSRHSIRLTPFITQTSNSKSSRTFVQAFPRLRVR